MARTLLLSCWSSVPLKPWTIASKAPRLRGAMPAVPGGPNDNFCMCVVLHGQHLQGLWWWAMSAVSAKCQDHRVLLFWTGGLRDRKLGDVQGKGTSESMWGSVRVSVQSMRLGARREDVPWDQLPGLRWRAVPAMPRWRAENQQLLWGSSSLGLRGATANVCRCQGGGGLQGPPAVGFMAPRGCSAPGKMRRPAWRTAARAAVASSVSCADVQRIASCCDDHYHSVEPPQICKDSKEEAVTSCFDSKCRGCGGEQCQLCREDARGECCTGAMRTPSCESSKALLP